MRYFQRPAEAPIESGNDHGRSRQHDPDQGDEGPVPGLDVVIPSKGWADLIRKVYEVDPMTCPRCGGAVKVVASLTEPAVVDRIIEHLKLAFVADRPPPPQAALQELLWEADPPAGDFPNPPAEYVP